jgi:tetrahydromethanopterin S-methyltransferase subunit B
MRPTARLVRRFFRLGLRQEVRDVVSIETSPLEERVTRLERQIATLSVELEDSLAQLRDALRADGSDAESQ